jgi:hypothetical protein
MPINYNPGVTFRGGELMSAGIDRGVENLTRSLNATVEMLTKKRDEHRAYAQLAGTLGLDPKTVTKEQVQATILGNEIKQRQEDRAREAGGRAATGNILQDLLTRSGGGGPVAGAAGAAEDAAAGIAGGTSNNERRTLNAEQRPVASGSRMLLEALNRNRDALLTDTGKTMLDTVIRNMGTPQRQPPQLVEEGGNKAWWLPTADKMTAIREPVADAGGGRAGMTEQVRQAWPQLEENEAWDNETTVGGTIIPGRYVSVDRESKKRTGKVAYDPQSAPRAGGSIVDAWAAGQPGGGGAGGAGGTMIMDADGKQWKYKGSKKNPREDTDEGNWEMVQ